MAATCIVVLILFLAIAASKDNHGDDISIQVFGGKDAKPGQFPFIGSLRYATFDYHGCGATLISNDTALTAAHCFEDEDEDPDNVPNLAVFGDLKLYETTASHHHSSFTAITHWEYDEVSIVNDIAIIYLKNPIDEIFEKNISSIPLASSSDEISDYSNCVVIGWGETEDYYSSNILQFTPLDLYNHTECDNIFGYSPEATTLCAGSPIADACVGDSGGPLACYRKDNPDIIELVGVVSYGIDVCSAGTPGVYTRVSAYRDWIQSRPRPQPNHATTHIIPFYFVILMIYISFYGYKY